MFCVNSLRGWEAIPIRLEAISSRLEAIASRLEASAMRVSIGGLEKLQLFCNDCGHLGDGALAALGSAPLEQLKHLEQRGTALGGGGENLLGG